MPIYLDRHDTPEEITPEHVAEMHQADLRVQDEFGCRGFTYWFDDKRKSGFCLIEAPNKEALIKMHDHAHGAVPHQIIEVEEAMVEAFLGRLEDPKKAKNEKLNIIDEPAFRTLLYCQFRPNVFANKNEYTATKKDIQTICNEMIDEHDGRVVKQKNNSLLCSFVSVSKALDCAIAISDKLAFEYDNQSPLKIALNCGVPITENKENIFEDTISLASRMCEQINGEIIASSEVIELYELENPPHKIKKVNIRVLSSSDQEFLNSLMNFVEGSWNKTDFMAGEFAQHLGLSKSQFYRKLKKLTKESPNTFIKKYRLEKALYLLKKGDNTIAEIAFDTGFNSPSYFSKCFQENFGLLPSSIS